MSAYPVRLPDVGEGVAEAELVQWLVQVGDRVASESPLAEVLTDKASVEVASPVSGVVTALYGEPGDRLTVGAPLATLETDVAVAVRTPSTPGTPAEAAADPTRRPEAPATASQLASGVGGAGSAGAGAGAAIAPTPAAPTGQVHGAPIERDDVPTPVAHDASTGDAGTPHRPARGPKALASPAVRARALRLGIDLTSVQGSGPEGRVVHADLDRLLGAAQGERLAAPTRSEPIRGVRRRIAENLTQAWEAPHITYVDEVDAVELEALRATFNDRAGSTGTRYTLLPFLVRALTIACAEHPQCNAHYDTGSGVLTTFGSVHVGIATQTGTGLIVPVIRDAQLRELDDIASEIVRLSTAAREGKATTADLTGSTITITSLGALGGIVTTPLLNRPEVAIVGINRMQVRPVWQDGAFMPRSMFNISSSFDHRIVDGYDAAVFVRRLKQLLEQPALLFADWH